MKKLLILLLLFGCASKKTVTEFKEVIKLDSIYITNDRYITKQINDTITIEAPCDTLGRLKDFSRVIRANNVKLSLNSVKGNIQAAFNIDSLVNSRISEFKQNYKSKTEIKEKVVVKFKTPLWLILLAICEGLIILILFRN